VPPRTLRVVASGRGWPLIHEAHSGQTQRFKARPLSAMRGISRGTPVVRRNAASLTITPMEKALLVIAWQSVQWQVRTNSGASLIS